MATVQQSTLSIQNPNAFFIGGEWEKPSGTDTLEVVSPSPRRS